jgi:hypothetical protein
LLSDYLRSKAEWRRRQEKDYPMDHRNERSAMALESLAEYVDGPDVSQSAVERLSPHFADAETLGGERTARAVSKYGWGTHITTDHALVRGEDPTGMFADFELEAAKDGVKLPRRYFEIRQFAEQDELKKAVEGHRAKPHESTPRRMS